MKQFALFGIGVLLLCAAGLFAYEAYERERHALHVSPDPLRPQAMRSGV
jgi:hypothetical protein